MYFVQCDDYQQPQGATFSTVLTSIRFTLPFKSSKINRNSRLLGHFYPVISGKMCPNQPDFTLLVFSNDALN